MKLIFLCLLSASSLWAVEIVYGGSGCLPGSSEIFSSPKQRSFKILPTAYEAKDGERKTCLLVLPARWPANTKIAISALQVKSHHQLEENGSAVFQAEFFMPGAKTKAMKWVADDRSKSTNSVWLIPENNQLLWTDCGNGSSGVNLRVNTSLIATRGSIKVHSLRVKLRLSHC